MRKRFKAVGFDLDQTLYRDSEEIRNAVRREIVTLISVVRREKPAQIELEFAARLEKLKSGSRVLSTFGIDNPREALRDCLDRANVHKFIRRDRELTELVAELKQSYQLFLVTDSREQSTIAKLAALGLDLNIFDTYYCWDGVRFKEDGTAFRYLAEKAGWSPAELIFVGNSEADDIRPVKALGWSAIYVGETPVESADHNVSSVCEIRTLLL